MHTAINPNHSDVISYQSDGSLVVAEKHLSIRELAEREGVPTATIYRWNADGNAPRRLMVGRHVRYRLADVLAWEESRYVDNRPAR